MIRDSTKRCSCHFRRWHYQRWRKRGAHEPNWPINTINWTLSVYAALNALHALIAMTEGVFPQTVTQNKSEAGPSVNMKYRYLESDRKYWRVIRPNAWNHTFSITWKTSSAFTKWSVSSKCVWLGYTLIRCVNMQYFWRSISCWMLNFNGNLFLYRISFICGTSAPDLFSFKTLQRYDFWQ